MKVCAEIAAVVVYVEDGEANWTREGIETLSRIVTDEAMRIYRSVDIPEGFVFE